MAASEGERTHSIAHPMNFYYTYLQLGLASEVVVVVVVIGEKGR